jgi:hypothetical protein
VLVVLPGLRVRVFETNDQQPHGGATGLTDRRLLGGGGGHGFPRDDPVFAIVARDADFSALAVEAHGERDFAEEALDQDQHRNAQNNRPQDQDTLAEIRVEISREERHG